MKFVKGMLVGGIVTAGIAMVYAEAMGQNKRKMKVMEAVEDFKTAYLKADRVGNGKKKELVLSCWINSLSIDNSLFSKSNEPLELLKTVNPYHIVILMVDILCGKTVRDDGGCKLC